MPNKCGVVNCNGNYNHDNKCRVFRMPRDEIELRKWLDVLPKRSNFEIDPTRFFICERHWPQYTPMINIPGGSTRPSSPPSIFDVPSSCLPTPKPSPRPSKQEDIQLDFFMKKDKITSFNDFNPHKELQKKYENIIMSKSSNEFVCVFMSKDFKESILSIVVQDKSTLCSPLTLSAYKHGICVPLGRILNPNNGLYSYSQFFEAVNTALHYDTELNDLLNKVVKLLQTYNLESIDVEKSKKLAFLIRQLQLLSQKIFSPSDFCHAIESFPKCNYEHLREILVLPSKSKIQSLLSTVDLCPILEKTFKKLEQKQKYAFLIIDEVHIRPTISFSGGVLNGMACNNPDAKATSMLCIMLRCLHGGPSLMVSVNPVNKLTAAYQFEVVKNIATVVENAGGIIIGSITDNHRINQQFCKLFSILPLHNHKAIHPLDEHRIWFLLYDTVHILKCIRNNWISEKTQQLSFNNENIASFVDIQNIYLQEKDHILKTTPLNKASVYPSRLQLQNVKFVLNIFNEKVVAALRLSGACDTANFVQFVLNWWNVVNVSGRGQDLRLNDSSRAVQEPSSFNLSSFLDCFKQATSGQGSSRIRCLTHDTKKALVQTTEGLIDVCQYLFSVGYKFVLLRQIQSDRIEGEFSVYRQSTGANAFMTAGNVFSAFKKRLMRFSASFLQSIDQESESSHLIRNHTCNNLNFDDASSIEHCIHITLSSMEESACAYVAGWLEMKCGDQLFFDENEPCLASDAKKFIDEVSRGSLTVPHMSTYELVRTGLCFIKKSKHMACCRHKLVSVLEVIDVYFDLKLASSVLFRRLANVLLHGLHKLYKDEDKNSTLYQTSIKKARMAD